MSIPKIIHYCWFGGNPLPKKDYICIESWKKYCPDYEIIEWNELNFDLNKNAYMKEAYEAHMWGFVSDYARLDIIFQYGGIYLDTDVELVRNLDDLLEQKAFMAFENETAVSPGLIIAAEPQNFTIKDMMEHIYGNRHFRRIDGTYDTVASPRMVTEYLVGKGLVCNNKFQNIDGILIYPKEYFCPKDYLTGQISMTENTYSIHHFNASWQTQRQKQWHELEVLLMVHVGGERMKKIQKTLLWRTVQLIYTKGFIYCMRRIAFGKCK